MPIVIDSLSKVFGANKVLSNVNLELPDNSINVLLGPNGAGKTTLAKCLSTQLVFEQGDILLDNVSYKKSKKGNIRKNISVLLDGNRGLYWNLTMNQNIQYFLGISNTKIGEVKDEINSLIEKFEIDQYQNKVVATLSKGTQQKISLIIALVKKCRFLILDEPNIALDISSLNVLKEVLNQKKKESIIFFTTQDIKLIEDLSDNIVMISKGEIAFKGNLASFSLLAEKTRFEITLDYNTNEDLFYRLKDLLKREDFNVIDNKTIIGNFTNSDFNAIMSFIYANGFAINRISKDEFTNSYNNALK